jgi:hypothetical protein
MAAAYRGCPHLSTHILCLLRIGAGRAVRVPPPVPRLTASGAADRLRACVIPLDPPHLTRWPARHRHSRGDAEQCAVSPRRVSRRRHLLRPERLPDHRAAPEGVAAHRHDSPRRPPSTRAARSDCCPPCSRCSRSSNAFSLRNMAILDHTWSLTVEEQFYVLWPPLVPALLDRVDRADLLRPVPVARPALPRPAEFYPDGEARALRPTRAGRAIHHGLRRGLSLFSSDRAAVPQAQAPLRRRGRGGAPVGPRCRPARSRLDPGTNTAWCIIVIGRCWR